MSDEHAEHEGASSHSSSAPPSVNFSSEDVKQARKFGFLRGLKRGQTGELKLDEDCDELQKLEGKLHKLLDKIRHLRAHRRTGDVGAVRKVGRKAFTLVASIGRKGRKLFKHHAEDDASHTDHLEAIEKEAEAFAHEVAEALPESEREAHHAHHALLTHEHDAHLAEHAYERLKETAEMMAEHKHHMREKMHEFYVHFWHMVKHYREECQELRETVEHAAHVRDHEDKIRLENVKHKVAVHHIKAEELEADVIELLKHAGIDHNHAAPAA